MCVRVYVCAFVCMCARAYAYVCSCVCVCNQVHMYMCLCVVYVRARVYAYVRAHIGSLLQLLVSNNLKKPQPDTNQPPTKPAAPLLAKATRDRAAHARWWVYISVYV